jgi:penicillin-binding protein 1C
MKRVALKRRLIAALRFAAFAAIAGWLGLKLVPIPQALTDSPAQSLELTDRHGVPLRETRRGEAFSRKVSLNDLPPRVVHAMLAAEDKRFFEHHGVDWLAVSRSIRDAIEHRRVMSGASTITQQLVKIAEPRPRNLRTKFIEAITAVRLEQLWTKQRILEEYLNRVDFGNLNVGFGAASDFYFGKPLSDLSEAEAAFIAGLPKNPSRLNPHRALLATQARQRTVLRRMRDNGWITSAQFERAASEPPRLLTQRRQFRAPHFVDLVLNNAGSTGSVRTTLDLGLNDFVQRQLREQLETLRSFNATNGAAVVIDNASGDVLALVGSGDYFAPGFGQFNGATARRSPGSTIKPITYLLALERDATPATIYADVPTEFRTATGNYRVDNYQRKCSGPVTLRSALACSLNIPAVHALNAIGGPAVLQTRLRDFGFTTLDRMPSEYGLGLTLGNAEARLLELTNAYAALARMGEYRPWLTSVASEQQASRQVADPRACWLLAEILSDNVARIPSFGVDSPLRFSFPVACKTGTSTDYRDNWAMAFTPEFTVGVWVGNFDGSPMRGVSGVTGAAPLMHAIMEHLHMRFGTTWFAPPPNIVECDVHSVTGKRVASARMDSRREKFLGEKLPELESPRDYDLRGRVILDPVFSEWFASSGNSLNELVVQEEPSALHIVSPVPGTTFVIDPDLPASRRARLSALGSDSVKWSSDSLQCTDGEAVLAEGEHRLVAIDPGTGARAETWIRVKSL